MAGEKRTRVARKNLEAVRRKAIDAVLQGVSPDDVAIAHGVGRSTVFGWLKMFAEGGGEALVVKQAPGAEPKLTQAQLNELRRWVVQCQGDVAVRGASANC